MQGLLNFRQAESAMQPQPLDPIPSQPCGCSPAGSTHLRLRLVQLALQVTAHRLRDLLQRLCHACRDGARRRESAGA